MKPKIIKIKKREGKKEVLPLQSPYKEKGESKEQFGNKYIDSQFRARTYASTHNREQCDEWSQQWREWLKANHYTKRHLYELAGGAADEICRKCFGRPIDNRIWSARMYLYPWAISQFLDRAFECSSCYRAGELRNPVTAFQSWINHNYPDPRKSAKGGAL